MTRLSIVLLPAVWVIAIAIVAVQNASPISLQFLGLRSIEMPFGVVLAFGASGGMITTACLLLLWGNLPKPQSRR